MVYSAFNYPNCPQDVICFTGEDISDKMIDQCFDIDAGFFEEKYLYDHGNVKKWVKKYSDFCFVFFDLRLNKVIGYNFLLLLDMPALESYLRGEISYFTIGINQFAYGRKNCEGALFYLSSAFSPNVNISLMMSMTQNAITDLLIEYKLRDNITVKKYFLDAVCDFDEKYSAAIKLKLFKNTAYNSKLYVADFNAKTFFPKAVNYDLLISAYSIKN